LREVVKASTMGFVASDVVPFMRAQANLSEWGDQAKAGAEKIITKNGESYVALIASDRLDYYHRLERERIHLLLIDDAKRGLDDILAGRMQDAAKPWQRYKSGERQKNMKLTNTAKLPKKTSAMVNDTDNPAWTEDMLGAPVIKRGRGPQTDPTKILTSVRLGADTLQNIIEPCEKVKYKLDDLVERMTEKNRHEVVSFGPPVGKETL